MRRLRTTFYCFAFLFFCFAGAAVGSFYNEGMIDKELRYQDFSVTDDGVVTGWIVNTSNKARHGVKLDMWITNVSETRIYWRKSIVLGDLPSGGKYEVKEPAKGDVDSSLKVEFHFRLQKVGELRNEGRLNR